MKLVLEFSYWPTSVTAADGKSYHPALTRGSERPFYWELITFATEGEAVEHAGLALKDAMDAANDIASQWNLVKL